MKIWVFKFKLLHGNQVGWADLLTKEILGSTLPGRFLPVAAWDDTWHRFGRANPRTSYNSSHLDLTVVDKCFQVPHKSELMKYMSGAGILTNEWRDIAVRDDREIDKKWFLIILVRETTWIKLTAGQDLTSESVDQDEGDGSDSAGFEKHNENSSCVPTAKSSLICEKKMRDRGRKKTKQKKPSCFFS